MAGLLRNRALWVGMSVPILFVIAFLVYGGTLGGVGSAGAYAQGLSAAQGRSAHDVHVKSALPTANEPTVSAESSMTALRATPIVHLPDSLANAVAGINAPSGPAGSSTGATAAVDPSQAHLLLGNVGSLGASIYAVTATTGKVCLFDTHGPASCIGQFTSLAPVLWDGEMTWGGTWTHLAGLVPDRVRSVALQENGTTEQAILRSNAFYVEPTGHSTALVLTYDDGTTETVPLPAGPPSRPSPSP